MRPSIPRPQGPRPCLSSASHSFWEGKWAPRTRAPQPASRGRGPEGATLTSEQAQHTRKRRGCKAASTHLEKRCAVRDAARPGPEQRSCSPEPWQGPRRRTVTSARLSGDCVTATRGRRGVYRPRKNPQRFWSACRGMRRDCLHLPEFSILNLVVCVPLLSLSLTFSRGERANREPQSLNLGKPCGNARARVVLRLFPGSPQSYLIQLLAKFL